MPVSGCWSRREETRNKNWKRKHSEPPHGFCILAVRLNSIGSVRQIAGRSFVAERSLNGNGTRITLPRVKRFAIGGTVKVGVFTQEIERRIFRRGRQPRVFDNLVLRVVCFDWRNGDFQRLVYRKFYRRIRREHFPVKVRQQRRHIY